MATFTHGSAAAVCGLVSLTETPIVPEIVHWTSHRTRLRYGLGVRFRRAAVVVRVRSQAEYDAFLAFNLAARLDGGRFAFVPDEVNHPDDVWSAVFLTDATFERLVPVDVPMVGEFSFEVEDEPVAD
jgi:hypothetical protein